MWYFNLYIFLLSFDILHKIWERMPKAIASSSSGVERVNKAELTAGTIWNLWPQARNLECMDFME